MTYRLLNTALALMLAIGVSGVALAAAPKTISYQGLLTDENGAPLANGTYQLTFKLYTTQTGGTPVWSEQSPVQVTDGIFEVILGSTAMLGLDFSSPYHLGISIDNDPELTPRIKLTAAPYAMHAISVADGSVTAPKIASGSVVRSLNGKTDAVSLIAGPNINITPVGNDLQLSAETQAGGDADWDIVGNDLVSGVSGNVGIGAGTPAERLHIASANDPTVLIQSDGINEISGRIAMRQSNSSGADIYYDGTNSMEGLAFETFVGTTSAGIKMFMQADGDLGIGTIAPEVPLHVVGGTDTGVGGGGYILTGDTSALNISMDENEIMARNNGAGSRLYLQAAGGGISIGTPSTSRAINMAGDAQIDVGADGDWVIESTNVHPTLRSTIYESGFVGNVNYPLASVRSHTFFAASPLLYLSYSDRSIKEDVRQLNGALDLVTQLRSVRYALTRSHYYRDGKQGTEEERTNQIGLIAQEVEEVLPEIVHTDEQTGLKSVGYVGLVPILVEALKEQQEVIERQQSDHDQLARRVEALERGR